MNACQYCKKILILAILICLPGVIILSRNNNDSLIKILKTQPEENKKTQILILLADDLKKNQTDSALSYINEAITFAENLADKNELVRALNVKGGILCLKNLLDEAGVIYQQAVKLSNEIKNIEQQARAIAGLGMIEKLKSNYPAAARYYKTSLELMLQTGNEKAIAESYTNMASGFGTLAQYDSSMYCQLKALEILEPLKDHPALGKAYSNMGAIYSNMGNFAEAVKYLNLAFNSSVQSGDKQQQMHVLSIIGNGYMELKKYEEAIKSHQASIQLGLELGRKIYVARGYQNLGSIEEAKNNYKDAMRNYLNSYSISKKLQSTADLIYITMLMGDCLNTSGKPAEALPFFTEGMNLSNDGDNQESLMSIYEGMKNSYELLKDYENAYLYQQKFTALKDSIGIKEKENIADELMLRYESGKKDQEILLLNLQNQGNERQKNFILLISGVVLLLLFTFFFIYRQRIQIAKFKETDNSRKQLELLRNKIASDLHDDLGSTLNSIKVYADVAGTENENKPYLEKIKVGAHDALAGVRDIIWMLDDKKDTVQDLVNRVNHFAGPLCEANHITLRIDADNSSREITLAKEEKRNLFMIIKEAVNNSIKYAGCRNIEIKIGYREEKLVLSIKDDGKGFDKNSVIYGGGLRNMNRRADEIGFNIELESAINNGVKILIDRK